MPTTASSTYRSDSATIVVEAAEEALALPPSVANSPCHSPSKKTRTKCARLSSASGTFSRTACSKYEAARPSLTFHHGSDPHCWLGTHCRRSIVTISPSPPSSSSPSLAPQPTSDDGVCLAGVATTFD